MSKKTLLFILLLALSGALLPVRAGRSVSKTVPATPGGTVSVELLSGSLRVEGWEREEVEVTGTLGEDVEDLDVDASGREVSIEIRLPQGRRDVHHADAELLVRVPSTSRIRTETISADVSVTGISGALEVESVSGTVRVEEATGEVEASSVSGAIRVAPAARISSGSFQTVSGDIEYAGDLEPDGSYKFESVSGNVVLRVGGAPSAAFEVETFSGRIDNELGPAAERTSPYLPAQSLTFSVGSGGARVKIESFSGRVELRR